MVATGRIVVIGTLALAAALAIRTAGIPRAKPPAPPAAKAEPPPKPAPPRRPASFGINLNALHPWTNERAFANLTMSGSWHSTGSGWPAFDPARIGPDGTVLSLKPGEQAALPLSIPAGAHRGEVRIRCTWEGRGELAPFAAKAPSTGANSLEFTNPKDTPVSVVLTRTDPTDPIRRIDCREPSTDRAARFDPAFLASLKPYKAVRFQGWQTVNTNTGGDWAKRTLPTAQYVGTDGVSVEDMVALCNEAGVDPWFSMDWKADATYQASFARYVHEHLDPARTVYLEIGNEVWNWGFNNSHLAVDLGKARKLSPEGDGDASRMRAYAVHATEAFAIWTKEYGADRKRLVRILAGQAGWPDLLKLALDYQDTAAQVDAIAMAPYFGYDFFNDANRATADTAALFRDLGPKVDEAIGWIRKDKALADRYGLRLIAYEAGQHLDYRGPDKTILARLARDPRMADLYARYFAGWKREAGDLMMLFTNVDPVGPNTNWGMVEYYGQPLAETPKLRALLAAEGG